MLNSGMMYLGNIGSVSKNNNFSIQCKSDSKNSFEQILEANKKDTRRSELNKNSKQTVQSNKQSIVKDNLDNNNESRVEDGQIKYCNGDNEKGDKIITDGTKKNSSDEEDKTLNSEEILQKISAVNELLQNLLNTYLIPEPVDSNEVLENKMLNSGFIEISSELDNIAKQLEESIKILNKLGQSQDSKLIQDVQDVINMLDNNTKNSTENNTDISFIEELKLHIDDIIKPIQNPSEPLNVLKQNNIQNSTDEIELTDEKNIIASTHNEVEYIDTNLENSKSNVKAEYFMGSDSANKNNTDTSRNLSNLVIDSTIKSNVQANEIFDVILNKDSASDEIINTNKDSIFEQIVDKIKVDFNNTRDEIKIKLKPEILGEMTVKVVVEKGIVTVKAFVENYHIKQLLESNVEQLKNSFKEQGLAFQALDVSVNKDPSFNGNGTESWANSKKIKNRKIKLNEVEINDIYDEINIQTASIMNVNSIGLDLIV